MYVFFIILCLSLDLKGQNNVIIENFFQNHTIEDFRLEIDLPFKAKVRKELKAFKRSGQSKYRRKKQFYTINSPKKLEIMLDIISQSPTNFNDFKFPCIDCKLRDTILNGQNIRYYYDSTKLIVLRKFITSQNTSYFFVLMADLKKYNKYTSNDILKWWSEAKIEELKDVFE